MSISGAAYVDKCDGNTTWSMQRLVEQTQLVKQAFTQFAHLHTGPERARLHAPLLPAPRLRLLGAERLLPKPAVHMKQQQGASRGADPGCRQSLAAGGKQTCKPNPQQMQLQQPYMSCTPSFAKGMNCSVQYCRHTRGRNPAERQEN